MTNIRPHKINASRNFLSGWYSDEDRLWDELVQYHCSSDEKREGMMTGNGSSGHVDKSAKDSTDVTLPRGELANRYIRALNLLAREYIAQYPYCNKLVPWGVVEPIAIQHYRPGGGYKIWHFERDNRNDVISRRHLAFMTYLNTVDDGGGTMFHYQDLTIKAEKGLTLIWPGEWTHTHRGEISQTQEKYIITGWFSTYTMEEFQRMQRRNN